MSFNVSLSISVTVLASMMFISLYVIWAINVVYGDVAATVACPVVLGLYVFTCKSFADFMHNHTD